MYTTCSKGIGRSAVTLRRGLLGALLAYLLTCTGIAMFQDHLLYYPDRATVAEMVAGGLAPWPSATDFRGLLAEPSAPARGTAIVFHGNAGHAGHRQFYVDALSRHGLRVILAEYPAYGPRSGQVGEENLVTDTEQTIALAHGRYGGPLLIIGESLGAGVAAAGQRAGARNDHRPAAVYALGQARTRRQPSLSATARALAVARPLRQHHPPRGIRPPDIGGHCR
jgi:alpha-beta hydrolase superfamily lysophospholipase